MVSAYSAKSNLLVLSINLVKKTFECKCTVVSMVVLDGGIGLSHDFFFLGLTAKIDSSTV